MILASLMLSVGIGIQELHAAPDASMQDGVMAEEVPAEAVSSAVAAVADLGNAVVQGRYRVALERMNPDWKNLYAKRVGGMKSLEDALEQVAGEMVRQGITMISCKPQGLPVAYGVAPTRRVVGADERLVWSKWLVLVPTVTQFRILQKRGPGEPPEWIRIESKSYQVAISARDRNEWTFIDGGGLSPSDLRLLFATLPMDIPLPPVEKREIR